MYCGLPNKTLDRENARIPATSLRQPSNLALMFARKSMVAHNGVMRHTNLHHV
jgi:hypothetical protein